MMSYPGSVPPKAGDEALDAEGRWRREVVRWLLTVAGVLLILLALRQCGFFDSRHGSLGTQGSTGRTGATGPEGRAGDTGALGPNGANGLDGTNGINGTNGADGTNGRNGAAGPRGVNGVNGSNGAPGATGTAGPPGPPGATGAGGGGGFGQGTVTAGACDSSIDIHLRSYWDNGFYLDSIELANVSTSCNGQQLTIAVVDSAGTALWSKSGITVSVVSGSIVLRHTDTGYSGMGAVSSTAIDRVALEIAA